MAVAPSTARRHKSCRLVRMLCKAGQQPRRYFGTFTVLRERFGAPDRRRLCPVTRGIA